MTAEPTSIPAEATLPTRPGYRPYLLEVARTRSLSPHFQRVTFTGADLVDFGTARLDQRIKVVLPNQAGQLPQLGQSDSQMQLEGTWFTAWRELPAEERPPFRTYTVRRIDPQARELDIDFVVHEGAGPAGAWAAAAEVGHQVVVVGPDQRSPDSGIGLDWHPGTARRVLLAGDETAVPAIAAILESLDATLRVDAFLEVPSAADQLELATDANLNLRWLVRGDEEHGAPLLSAVTGWAEEQKAVLALAAAPRAQDLADVDVDQEILWDSPLAGEGEFYAWIAGEAGAVKLIRRLLVQGHGVDRKRIAFMGYWRLGKAERFE